MENFLTRRLSTHLEKIARGEICEVDETHQKLFGRDYQEYFKAYQNICGTENFTQRLLDLIVEVKKCEDRKLKILGSTTSLTAKYEIRGKIWGSDIYNEISTAIDSCPEIKIYPWGRYDTRGTKVLTDSGSQYYMARFLEHHMMHGELLRPMKMLCEVLSPDAKNALKKFVSVVEKIDETTPNATLYGYAWSLFRVYQSESYLIGMTESYEHIINTEDRNAFHRKFPRAKHIHEVPTDTIVVFANAILEFLRDGKNLQMKKILELIERTPTLLEIAPCFVPRKKVSESTNESIVERLIDKYGEEGLCKKIIEKIETQKSSMQNSGYVSPSIVEDPTLRIQNEERYDKMYAKIEFTEAIYHLCQLFNSENTPAYTIVMGLIDPLEPDTQKKIREVLEIGGYTLENAGEQCNEVIVDALQQLKFE